MRPISEIYKSLLPSLQWQNKEEIRTNCPLHDDGTPSLSINTKSGLWYCHACNKGGTAVNLYMEAQRVPFETAAKDLGMDNGKGQRTDATYDYTDEAGTRLFQVVRREPKTFRQRRPDGKGGWIWNTQGVRLVPYDLPEVLKADLIIDVEGEKDVETLKKMGLTGTTNPRGAGKWRPEFNKYFSGKSVVILPDNDEPGRNHAQDVAKNLYGIAKSVKVVELPGLPEKGDVSEWVKIAGNTREKLLEIITGTHDWTPNSGIEDVEKLPDPIPFDDHSLLPDFPCEALPDIGREIVGTVSEVNQVDTSLTASIYIAVLSSALSGKVKVDLTTHREPVNIYVASILPSGERKSATLGVMTQPVYNFQAMRQKEMSEVILVALNAHEIRTARLAKLYKSAANAKNPVETERSKQDAETLVKEIHENPVPPLPTFICDDITTEALGVLMSDNGERLSVMSAEGGIFGIMNGRYSDKGSNFDLYLKAHSGDPWSCHRISRDNKTMLSPALTMCLTIQPDVIHEIGMIKSFRGLGLLARFLYSSCNAQAGYRIRQNKEIPASLLSRYEEHVHSLMNIDVSEQILRLSPEAQLLWDNFYSDIEGEMREGGSLDNLKDWGSKLPGAVARISGLLHMATHGAEGVGIPISAGIVGASCVIGCFYKEHAIATFNMMKTDPRIEAAKLILEYISRHKPEHFKGRDVLANKNAFKTMDDVIPGLKILLERGYIRDRETISLGVGRPEAVSYIVNSKLYENHQQYLQNEGRR